MDKVEKSEQQWREELSPEEYHVLREKGTERAFTGAYWDSKDDGVYRCRACGQELFSSDTKFDSGTGWPSFYEPADGEAVATEEDRSFFMRRTEVNCSRCGSHLGHVFDDGPHPPVFATASTRARWSSSRSSRAEPTARAGHGALARVGRVRDRDGRRDRRRRLVRARRPHPRARRDAHGRSRALRASRPHGRLVHRRRARRRGGGDRRAKPASATGARGRRCRDRGLRGRQRRLPEGGAVLVCTAGTAIATMRSACSAAPVTGAAVPGTRSRGASLIVERGVAGIGIDTLSVDAGAASAPRAPLDPARGPLAPRGAGEPRPTAAGATIVIGACRCGAGRAPRRGCSRWCRSSASGHLRDDRLRTPRG